MTQRGAAKTAAPHFERKNMMEKNKKRFVRTYTQGTLSTMEIWVDTQTGVNYLFQTSGYAGGLTVLLDRDGKPVISPLPVQES